ncbi:MAG: hypothetical protein Q7R49_01865 [Candidatus Daviesbacteria bacterium]|nr:hypothetical protein [Candidatus Daviesbacteria bacterium]
MLDTLDKGINIRDLNIEEPNTAPDFRFNPDRDIPVELKAAFKNKLTKSFSDRSWWDFQRFAFEARVLFPEDLKPYSGLESDPFDEMKLISLQVYLKQQNFDFPNYLAFASQFKMALGLSDKAMGFFDGDKLWGKLAGPGVNDLSLQEQSDLLFYSRVLLPKNEQPRIDPSIKNFLMNRLKRRVERFHESSNTPADRLAFLKGAFHFKVLFPNEDTTEFNNDEVWTELKKYWKIDVGLSGMTGTAMAAYLVLLGAEKIEMTDSGLVVTPRQPTVPLTETIPALPEMRKF